MNSGEFYGNNGNLDLNEVKQKNFNNMTNEELDFLEQEYYHGNLPYEEYEKIMHGTWADVGKAATETVELSEPAQSTMEQEMQRAKEED